MKPQQDMELLNTFVRSAQYIVGLSSNQDLWDHLGRLLVGYFHAQWTAVVHQEPAGGLTIDYCAPPGAVVLGHLQTEEVRAVVADVLDSGFLASRVLPVPAPSMTVVLPLGTDPGPRRALLIGHETSDALPSERLNIYLALSGLAGTMLQRLHAERELALHRDHLEELVTARTHEVDAAKRHNELILNSIAEGILGVDPAGCISFINPAGCRLTGWEPQELAGRNVHETFRHSQCDGSAISPEQCPIHSTLKDGGAHLVTDALFFRKEGTAFPVEFRTAPILEDGRIVGAVLVFRDITEQKQAQERLRRTAEDLARSNKDLEQFAYVSSHDLQEPLRMVSSFMHLLRKKYEGRLGADGDMYIRHAVDGATRMQQLIHDLLAYSRVGTKGNEPKVIDSLDCLRGALDNLQAAIQDAGAEITHGPLPPVRADATQLTQLFQNLIGNAIKFRRDQRPAIRVEACRDGNCWLFSVKDNGIGIDQEFSDKIFVIFQRLHTKEQYPGTGIGLAICKKIVERHGGRIWFDSVPGQGTTFYFTFLA